MLTTWNNLLSYTSVVLEPVFWICTGMQKLLYCKAVKGWKWRLYTAYPMVFSCSYSATTLPPHVSPPTRASCVSVFIASVCVGSVDMHIIDCSSGCCRGRCCRALLDITSEMETSTQRSKRRTSSKTSKERKASRSSAGRPSSRIEIWTEDEK